MAITGKTRRLKKGTVGDEASSEAEDLSRIINSVAIPVFVKDRKHRWILLNDAWCALIGRRREEMIGKSDYEFFPKAQADIFWAKDEEVFTTGRVNINEEEFTDSLGALHILSTRKKLCLLAGCKAVLVGVIHDITEFRRAVSELQYKNSLLAAQSEASIEGILVVDEHGGIISFNDRFVKIWRIPPEVIKSKSDELALGSVMDKLVDPEKFLARVRYLYRHRHKKSYDEIPLKDGRTFERYSAPVFGDDGRYYGRIWSFRDVSELRKLVQLRAEIKQRLKLDEMKDRFIGTVSHELRTPLTVIRSVHGLMEEQMARNLSPQVREGMAMCRRNLDRLTKMINNLLDISRLESGRARAALQRVNLRDLLDDAVAGIRTNGRVGRLELVVDAPGTLECLADPDMLMEVLVNLLDNATRLAKTWVRLRVRREGARLRVEVSDDGPGIAPDRIPELFNRFVQVSRSVGASGYKGTGLGLAICKEIMRLHGSKIEVESTLGRGVTFRFLLDRGEPVCEAGNSKRGRH